MARLAALLVFLLAALPSAYAAELNVKFLHFLASPAATKAFRAIGLSPAS